MLLELFLLKFFKKMCMSFEVQEQFYARVIKYLGLEKFKPYFKNLKKKSNPKLPSKFVYPNQIQSRK